MCFLSSFMPFTHLELLMKILLLYRQQLWIHLHIIVIDELVHVVINYL
jgi:hypothetical protein